MRLHPSVTGVLSRTVPIGGYQAHKMSLPAGTSIGASAAVVHFDEDVFGQNVDLYQPERWLSQTSPSNPNPIPSLFTFGLGKRICPGRYVSSLDS